MTKYEKQLQLILAQLKKYGRLTIDDGIRLLDVTESSVRRIFSKIDSEGLALRIHGGIASLSENSSNLNYCTEDESDNQNVDVIAKTAVKLLYKGGNVFLGPGFLVGRIARELANIFINSHIPDLRIYTNSSFVFDALKNYCPLYLCSGQYRPTKCDFTGYMTRSAIEGLNFDLSILSPEGFDKYGNLTTSDFDSSDTMEEIVKHTSKLVIAMSSSRLGKTYVVNFARVDEVNSVITDVKADKEMLAYLKENNIDVTIAK